ncbi:MAG: NHL repeat-containing protein [Gallionella sp.]
MLNHTRLESGFLRSLKLRGAMRLSLCGLVSLLVVACGGGGSGNTAVVPPTAQLEVLAGDIGGSGNIDGIGAAARFTSPMGVAADAAGNLYVADSDNSTIRKISPSGAVTTFAGSAGHPGTDNGTGDAARFSYPTGLAVDSGGNLFVADDDSIRKITPAGVVTTYAGIPGSRGYANGNGGAAQFDGATGLACDASGNLYVADQTNQVIRMITPTGDVSTLAGTPGTPGWQDGTANSALFNYPTGVAVDTAGTVYVADSNNHIIRAIATSGSGIDVSTLAGMYGAPGFLNAAGTNAQFSGPSALTLDSSGNLYVTDSSNHVLRKITSTGDVTTFAGTANQQGYDDGNGAAARFDYPGAIGADATGNLYVAQYGDHTIRKISLNGDVTTIAGAPAIAGYVDATGVDARFDVSRGIATDAVGNAYVADGGLNGRLRRVTPTGDVTTLLSTLSVPGGVARDRSGNTYLADTYHHVIRKLEAGGTESILAGSGNPGWIDANGTSASFDNPGGVAVDGSGNVYVADTNNHTIRMIDPNGDVSTIAGSPGALGNIDDTGAAARFRFPQGVACDAGGTLYVADRDNFAIRKIAPGGIVTTFAGTMRSTGAVDGAGTAARFSTVSGIAVDDAGNLFVADTANNAVRKISTTGDVTTVIGAFGRRGVMLGDLPASLDAPNDVAVNADGELLVTTLNGVVVTHGYK